MLIDTHCHLFKEYFSDIDSIINNAKKNNVGLFISASDNINSCKEIIRQKVNKNNIDLVISEFEDFLTPKGEKFDQSKIEKKSVTEIVRKMLYEIKGY